MTKKESLSKSKKERFVKMFKKLLNNRKRVVVLIVSLSVVGFIGWRVFAGKEEKPQFQTAPVERGMIISSVSASGQVLSVNIMSASTKASGIVKEVYVKDGDIVKTGDRILEIELDFQGEQKYAQARSSYLSAKNSLESAETAQYSLQSDMFNKWKTFKDLAESSSYDTSEERNLVQFRIAENDWLAAEAKYKNQEAVIVQVQAGLNSAWLSYLQSSPAISSPTKGTITSLMFAEGMSIGALDTGSSSSNQKVATIKTEGMPIVSVNLSEIDVSRVEIDQKATITLDSLPDKTFTGRVVGVDRIGQTISGVTQYASIIRLDSSAVEILPNMTATANIVIERKDSVLLVPSSAVQSQGGQSYASVLVDDKPQFIPVEIGLISDTQTEIVSGLAEGNLVVTGTLSSDTQQNGASPFGGGGIGGMMRIAH